MRTVAALLRSAEKIKIKPLVRESLQDVAADYVEAQRAQLMRGERESGLPIFNVKTGSTEYSPGYAKKKGRKKPIDLKDKGDFHRDIFFQDNDQDFIVDSADSKSAMLQENYGTGIFGLNDTSREAFHPIAHQKLVDNTVVELNKKA